MKSVLLLLATGLLLAAGPATPRTAGADTAPVKSTPVAIEAVRIPLRGADAELAGATLSTHGGYVEKSRADIARALALLDDDAGLARANPAIPPPATPAENLAALYNNLGYIRPAGGGNQPNMYGALAQLRSAIAMMQIAPSGELGDAREPLVAAISAAASDIVAGIKVADGGRGSGARGNTRGTASADTLIQSKIAAAEARDRETARQVFADADTVLPIETARQRLQALEKNLRTALAVLEKPTSNPFVDGVNVTRPAAALREALDEIAAAQRHLDAHPDDDALPYSMIRVSVPGLDPPSGMALFSSFNPSSSYPHLETAMNAMLPGLRAFLTGTSPVSSGQRGASALYRNPGGGGPPVGALDGHRDCIIRRTGEAIYGLMDAVNASRRPTQVVATATGALKGRVTGVVLDSAGDPAANVLIYLNDSPDQNTVRSAGRSNGGFGTGGFVTGQSGPPVTLTDANGAFTIPDVMSGPVILTARLLGARGEWQLSASCLVEVKPGATATPAGSIKLFSF